MKKCWIAMGALMALPLGGCDPEAKADGSEQSQANDTEVMELDVAQATSLHQDGKATFVDANGEKTRKEHGVVPGAILLTSSGRYDVSKELPKDKRAQLVFYCGSEHCSASDGAAGRAIEAGYSNVCVMRPGIKGWVEAGNAVTKQPAS